jgi:hypothetical protein
VSDLLRAQRQFFFMLPALFAKAVELHLPLKVGCALCNQEGHHSPNSLHHDALAIDLHLVWDNGTWGSWEDYRPLGEYWESLGGSWGGRFDLNGDGTAKDDPNHFSLAYGGRR